MANRFDLEEKIMAAWTSVDDLKLLSSYIADVGGMPLTQKSRILDILDSIITVSSLRFEKLFETFEDVCCAKVTKTVFDKFDEDCDTIPFD